MSKVAGLGRPGSGADHDLVDGDAQTVCPNGHYPSRAVGHRQPFVHARSALWHAAIAIGAIWALMGGLETSWRPLAQLALTWALIEW